MNKLTVLVSSCDKFSDCWEPFIHSIKKYWPDCPADIFIITNFKDINDDRVKALKVGEDKGWAKNMLAALDKIESPFLLYMQEDFWLKMLVDTRVLDDYLGYMNQGIADYVRLVPFPPADYDFQPDKRLGIIAEQSSYRTALQAALWRKSVLAELIDANESPWQFEKGSASRSKRYGDKFLCVKEFYDNNIRPYYYGIDYVCTAVIKGRWSREAVDYAEREGLKIDFSGRPKETMKHDLIRIGSGLKSRAKRMIRRRIKQKAI